MLYWLYTFSLGLCILGYYVFEHYRTKAIHRQIIQREGCQPLRCLPNKWFPPFGLDKLGNVTEAERTKTYPLLMLREHEKHGDTYAQWSGPVYTVITRDTRNIREILSRQFKSFEVGAGRHGCIRPLLGDGIFTQDGPKWEASRKLLAPMIQRPTLPDLRLIERHFQLLQSAITPTGHSEDASAVPAVDIKEHLFDMGLNLTTEFLLGKEVDSTSTDSRNAKWTSKFAEQFNTAFKWISKRERLKGFYWMIDGLEFRRSCSAARGLVDDLVSKSMEARKLEHVSSENYVALDPLLRQEQDSSVIRDQFMNLLLAGRDTSGGLISWVFYALAREPDLVETLRKEIDDAIGLDCSRTPTKDELNAMVKLDQCICETLRLFPPLPLNGRFSIRSTSLPHGGGEDGQAPILIPEGTLIAYSPFAVHHNRDLYGEDASKFRIGRWDSDQTKEKRMIDWSYQPFSGGPRKCLGERFAVTQAKYLTCRMLQHYKRFIPIDEGGKTISFGSNGSWVDDVKYHVGVTMMPDKGVWLRMMPS